MAKNAVMEDGTHVIGYVDAYHVIAHKAVKYIFNLIKIKKLIKKVLGITI